MKVACVVLAKDERQYMEEWLKYHTELGIDKFFIVNNNDIPVADDYEDDLFFQNKLAEKYPVKFFQLYGQDALTIAGKQRGVFNTIVNQFVRPEGFDWVTFIDIDEFMYLDGKKLKDFLAEPHFADTDVIHLNWRVYTDNGQIYNSDKPVQERFTQQAPLDAGYNGDEIAKGIRENMFVKSLVRLSDKRTMFDTHTSYVENGRCRRGNGNLSDCRWSAENLSDDNHYIKHYISKSLEEYIRRRCLRPTDVAHYVTPVEKRIKWYFNLNEKTPEKVEYIKNVLGIDV